jgi:hypothetical protein
MAQMPIEIVEIGDLSQFDLSRALSLANSLQKEFSFCALDERDAKELRNYAFRKLRTDEFLKSMDECRTRITGFHPYLIAFVDSYLIGKDYENIFGSDHPEKGLAVFTTHDVPELIIPKDRMLSYFMYYLAKATLCFLAPEHENHGDTQACPFDQKVQKKDILRSMRARALCDKCRRKLLQRSIRISGSQLAALDRLFETSGNLLDERHKLSILPRAFVGSSTEGLIVARQLKLILQDDLEITVWDEGTVFGLSETTIEALEDAVLQYDYGIFVITSDDKLESRGEVRQVARDNVLFELGLFMGRLTRKRIIVVQQKGVSMPTDLSGFVTARYTSDSADELQKAANGIKAALGHVRSKPSQTPREPL